MSATPAELATLLSVSVSGRPGADGATGARGADGVGSGADGRRGASAGPAEAGQHAGKLRIELVDSGEEVTIRGTRVAPGGGREDLRTSIVLGATGVVELLAVGGDGGSGGDGGDGGHGARGEDGDDATRWRDGTDGRPGGDGGDGGDGTSGGDGGDGGEIAVTVSDEDTPLLMLIRHRITGGAGGAPGKNGAGGAGGAGGEGGDSYSWSDTDYYTDSNGNRQSTTTYHRNSGGDDGRAGSHGRSGGARLHAGARGRDGRFSIEVRTAAGVQAYPSRYDLRLVSFAHDSLNEDCVYEPGEIARVFGLVVENCGGMPTPAHDELELSLVAGGWIEPEAGVLRCVRALAAGARHEVAGELRFRIAAHVPDGPGDPLEIEASILHRAMLPSVARAFEAYQEGAAIDAGKLTIRYPVALSEVTYLRSLAAGEAARVRFTVTNRSRLALGAGAPCGRVLRVRVATAPASELGDEHVAFAAGGPELPPSTGWLCELPALGPGESRELELTVAVKEGAPEYRRFAALISLELGGLDEPAAARPVQLRAFDVRVARRFRPREVDLLLVVNHRTSREEVLAWEAAAGRLSFQLGIWDLSRERHLDLEAPLEDGRTLRELLAGRAIAILDNEIDGPGGPAYPHQFVCADQAVRAAAGDRAQREISLAFLGKGPALDRLLVPAHARTRALAPPLADDATALVKALGETAGAEAGTSPRAAVAAYRRHWLMWWAEPEPGALTAHAHALSAELAAALPHQRHLVVHRFQPEVASRFLWIKRWRLGTLETVRTLDAAAGAIVHASIADDEIHDPRLPDGATAAVALLLAFDFGENLARLGRLATAPDADELGLERLVDALLVDLANELWAAVSPGWRRGASSDDLDRALPRLNALSSAGLSASYESIGGGALLRLAGRLRFLGDSLPGFWDRLPPWRWWRRGAAVRAHVERHVERLLSSAFGAHNLPTALRETEELAASLTAAFAQARREGLASRRRDWALAALRTPQDLAGLTSDAELLATHELRVLTGDEYDAIARDQGADAARREYLVASLGAAHRALTV